MIHPIVNLGAPNVHQIELPWAKPGDFYELMHAADLHIDNTKCDRSMLKEHLEEAKLRKAGITFHGDIFDVMGGKYDPRSSKESLRPEHKVANYLDAVVDTTAEFLEPYKDNILLLSYGNHETSIIKRHETDLISRLAKAMGTGVAVGGYGGYLKLQFYRSKDSLPVISGPLRHSGRSLLFKYFHGFGGGGPVTKGVIQSYRQSIMYPDADIVFSGHVHEAYMIEYVQERVNQSGKMELKTQYHLRTPTYKEEHCFDLAGWHVERSGGGKPMGSWIIKYRIKNAAGDIEITPSRLQ